MINIKIILMAIGLAYNHTTNAQSNSDCSAPTFEGECIINDIFMKLENILYNSGLITEISTYDKIKNSKINFAIKKFIKKVDEATTSLDRYILPQEIANNFIKFDDINSEDYVTRNLAIIHFDQISKKYSEKIEELENEKNKYSSTLKAAFNTYDALYKLQVQLEKFVDKDLNAFKKYDAAMIILDTSETLIGLEKFISKSKEVEKKITALLEENKLKKKNFDANLNLMKEAVQKRNSQEKGWIKGTLNESSKSSNSDSMSDDSNVEHSLSPKYTFVKPTDPFTPHPRLFNNPETRDAFIDEVNRLTYAQDLSRDENKQLQTDISQNKILFLSEQRQSTRQDIYGESVLRRAREKNDPNGDLSSQPPRLRNDMITSQLSFSSSNDEDQSSGSISNLLTLSKMFDVFSHPKLSQNQSKNKNTLSKDQSQNINKSRDSGRINNYNITKNYSFNFPMPHGFYLNDPEDRFFPQPPLFLVPGTSDLPSFRHR